MTQQHIFTAAGGGDIMVPLMRNYQDTPLAIDYHVDYMQRRRRNDGGNVQCAH